MRAKSDDLAGRNTDLSDVCPAHDAAIERSGGMSFNELMLLAGVLVLGILLVPAVLIITEQRRMFRGRGDKRTAPPTKPAVLDDLVAGLQRMTSTQRVASLPASPFRSIPTSRISLSGIAEFGRVDNPSPLAGMGGVWGQAISQQQIAMEMQQRFLDANTQYFRRLGI
jgi:hypothetical protein